MLADMLGVFEDELYAWLRGMEQPPAGLVFVALHIAASRPCCTAR